MMIQVLCYVVFFCFSGVVNGLAVKKDHRC